MCEMQSTVLLKEIADIEVELEDLIAQDHVRPVGDILRILPLKNYSTRLRLRTGGPHALL